MQSCSTPNLTTLQTDLAKRILRVADNDIFGIMFRVRLVDKAHARITMAFLTDKFKREAKVTRHRDGSETRWPDQIARVYVLISSLPFQFKLRYTSIILRLYRDTNRNALDIAKLAVKRGHIDVLECYDRFSWYDTCELAQHACVHGSADALDWLSIHGTITSVSQYYIYLLRTAIGEGFLYMAQHIYEKIRKVDDKGHRVLKQAAWSIERKFKEDGPCWAIKGDHIDVLRWMVESFELQLSKEAAYCIVVSHSKELCKYVYSLDNQDEFHEHLECYAFGEKAVYYQNKKLWKLPHIIMIADFAYARATKRCIAAENRVIEENEKRLELGARILDLKGHNEPPPDSKMRYARMPTRPKKSVCIDK